MDVISMDIGIIFTVAYLSNHLNMQCNLHLPRTIAQKAFYSEYS